MNNSIQKSKQTLSQFQPAGWFPLSSHYPFLLFCGTFLCEDLRPPAAQTLVFLSFVCCRIVTSILSPKYPLDIVGNSGSFSLYIITLFPYIMYLCPFAYNLRKLFRSILLPY